MLQSIPIRAVGPTLLHTVGIPVGIIPGPAGRPEGTESKAIGGKNAPADGLFLWNEAEHMSTLMNGARMLLECLAREGVECIFGYPGGVTLPLYDALYDH